jgi:hypothetical protein
MMAGRNVERRLSGRARRDRSDAPKGQKNLAHGFNPGLRMRTRRPESTPNPTDAGCNSDNAQYSSTPKLPPATLRVAMRAGHHSARQNSRTRTTTRTRTKRLTSGARGVKSLRRIVERIVRFGTPKSGATFRAHSVKTRYPGLKPWAESFCPFGACTDRRPRKRGLSTFVVP